jgi:hypothetical protein
MIPRVWNADPGGSSTNRCADAQVVPATRAAAASAKQRARLIFDLQIDMFTCPRATLASSASSGPSSSAVKAALSLRYEDSHIWRGDKELADDAHT